MSCGKTPDRSGQNKAYLFSRQYSVTKLKSAPFAHTVQNAKYQLHYFT